MIAVLGGRAFRAERDDDAGPVSAQKVHDLANKPIRVSLAEGAVGVSRRRERGDPENFGSRRELHSPQGSQFGPRRNRDAGALSGIPIGGAKQIDLSAAGGKLRDRSTRREGLVVGMREYTAEPAHR